jgi:hypothetical protein
MRAPSPSRALPALALVGLVATGCSQGADDFSGNNPDPKPAIPQVVRTPSPLGDDQPATDPPLVVPLPGPSGGAPGTPNPTVPEASPGQSADTGGGTSN